MTHYGLKLYYTITYLAVLVVSLLSVYGNYQSYQTSIKERQQIENSLIQQSRKAKSLIDTNESKVIYLAPEGAKAKKDTNADIINEIIKKTFAFDSPNEFYKQAKFIKNRVEGPFYQYWFGPSLKRTYNTLVLEQNGSTLKRNYQNYVLTKKANGHYFAVITTYTKLGYDDRSTPNNKTFGLDITWNKHTGKWHFVQLPNVDMQ